MAQKTQTAIHDNARRIGAHNPIQYESKVTTAMLGDKKIRVEHLTPILSPQEREVRRREIENRLFEVFSKYVEVEVN